MPKSEMHKKAVATLRILIRNIETLTANEASDIVRLVETRYLAATAMRGRARRLKEGKRGRKPQEGKELADIMTPSAPADLPEKISEWAKMDWSAPPSRLAALAVSLVELGYISDGGQKAMHTALLNAIPPGLRVKYGVYSSFSRRFREMRTRERDNWGENIECFKEMMKAP